MRTQLHLNALACLLLLACSTPNQAPPSAAAIDLYVSRGDDALAQALAEARAQRQLHPDRTIVINLPDHINARAPILIGRADSGNLGAPLIIEGAAGGSTISGSDELVGVGLDASEQTLFAPNAAPHILTAHFPQNQSVDALTLFDASGRLSPARLPDHGYLHTPNATERNGRVFFRLEPQLVSALSESNAPRIAGYFRYDWLFETFAIRIEDAETVSFPLPQFGVGASPRFFFQNIPAGLTEPGRFYADPSISKLYFFSSSDHVRLARDHELVVVDSAHDILLRQLRLAETAQSAISINNSRDVTLEQCFIQHANAAINVNSGVNVHIRGCYINDMGGSGILITGGDRATLQPGGNTVEDTVIENFGQVTRTYAPGLRLTGVGNTLMRSEIACAPHAAVIFSGNDLIMRDNIIHDVAADASDAGAVYGGRDWTQRGNLITGNLFYAIEPKVPAGYVVAVYLDDQLSGTEISENLFLRTPIAILIGGGRDNIIRQNAFLTGVDPPIHMDARGLSFQQSGTSVFEVLMRNLTAVPYQNRAYAKYPGLADINAGLGEPTGNLIANNLYAAHNLVAFDTPHTESYLSFTTNAKIGASRAADSSNVAGEKGAPSHLLRRLRFESALLSLPPLFARVAALESTARSLEQVRARWNDEPGSRGLGGDACRAVN